MGLKEEKYNAKEIVKFYEILSEKIGSVADNPRNNFEDDIAVMDCANVMMITAKSKRAKYILNIFDDKDDNKIVKPELSNKGKETGYCIFSKNYMDFVFRFFNISSKTESLKIEVFKDYPIRVWDDDWEIIVAPRIDMEEVKTK